LGRTFSGFRRETLRLLVFLVDFFLAIKAFQVQARD
jgi:hypothetical protein